MQRYYAVLIVGAVLLAGCVPLTGPAPTAVVRPTERPALPTRVPTFTPTAELAPAATELPSPAPTAPFTSSPTVRAAATATEPPAAPAAAPATQPPTAAPTAPPLAPPPTRTRAPAKAPARPPATAAPAPTAAPAAGGAWRGEYFSNQDLSGTPALVRNDGDVNFDWGLGSPDPSIPTDHFSVRWTRSVSLGEGRWRFHATSDDGVRVFVDGVPIIDQWHTTASVTYNTSATLSAGVHLLRVDYYENVEQALVHVWWEWDNGSATDPAHSGAWRGDYYDNQGLADTPVFSRDDPAIYFDWGEGGPGGGIAGTNFSVRWTRRMFIPQGTYRVYVKSDDGVRVWLDWHAIIDQWHDSPADTTYEQEIYVGNGDHELVVEYYQDAGSAQVHMTWEPTTGDWLANLHTCLPPQDGMIKVYRLAPNDQWQDLNPGGYFANNAEGNLAIFGLPVDATFGWDGQPYRVELWIGGRLAASQGNIFAGQPAFRIVPGQDAQTSWTCVGGTVTQ